ncbi:M20/M25/M40 family metallo-hydrolase [Patulibacter defluvii]|uniref:M20/M25/M40 family metallo-hydrolase n=1 Tax=Patulibacter defluvii TaxID=3095358 RepID=UPI002A74A2A8|nr:M20/M25/M40 family metallo-hydrolase [Patulibacter sp. DM4]
MSLPDVLRELLTTPGPSGREAAAAAVWRRHAGAFAEVEHDVVGSSVARVPATTEGVPSLAVVGHIDEIGLIVTHVDDRGFLRVAQVGGWDPQQLVGQRVRLLAKGGEISGVVGKKPIHLMEPDDRTRATKLKELTIDIGARDREDALEVVRVGDVAVIDVAPLELRSGRVASRSLDNRVGSFVAYETARLVAEAGGAPGEVQGWAVTQEETGLSGAKTTAHRVRPQIAVVVDVTFASDQPGVDSNEIGEHPLGSGPVIERGTPLHPWVTDTLIEVAEAEGIEHTISAVGRATGTDADAIHIAADGIPTAVVSVPLRYMHSSVETVQVSDVLDTARLLAAFARRLDASVDLRR